MPTWSSKHKQVFDLGLISLYVNSYSSWAEETLSCALEGL